MQKAVDLKDERLHLTLSPKGVNQDRQFRISSGGQIQPHSRYERFPRYGDAQAYHADARKASQAYEDLRDPSI